VKNSKILKANGVKKKRGQPYFEAVMKAFLSIEKLCTMFVSRKFKPVNVALKINTYKKASDL